MRTALLLIAALMAGVCAASSQDVIPADTLKDWHDKVVLADQVVGARYEALKKLPEFQAYEAAVKQRTAVIDGVNARVAARVPGYAMDMMTGKLVPYQAKK